MLEISRKYAALPLLTTLLSLIVTAPSFGQHRQVSKVQKTSQSQKLPSWSVNIKVPYRAWIPLNKPKEVLLCVHGLGFNSASYSQFGRSMAARGFAVYALDVRGFGQWMKRKGENTVNFEACLTDIESALKILHKQYPGTPVFMLGESMGGAIAMAASARYPDLVDGLVSAVPSSDRYAKLSSELVVGVHYVGGADEPMNMAPEVVTRSTDDPALRARIQAEPLNRMQISPKELKQFETFMKGNYDAAHLIEKTPVLMVAGFKDQLVKPEGTIELFNALSTTDKLLMVVGDGEHLLFEENQMTPQLAALVTDWIRTESVSLKPRYIRK